jgi:hypothetical protein
MRLLYQLLLLIGLASFVAGAWQWATAGFPITFGELSTTLTGVRPWQINKESCFFFMVLGLVFSCYCAIEIHHKLREKKR